jgi:hypothetical protein
VRPPTILELRRGALAVSVLHDVDVEPAHLGITLTGTPPVWLTWAECRTALVGEDPETPAGRERLAAWVLARRWAADAGREAVQRALRPVGLPVDHVLHPGADWVQERVLGGVLELGLGAVGLDPQDPDRVVLLPGPALDDLDLPPALVWPAVRTRLEELGRLAVERARRDPKGQLRPYGDADAVTLLGARSLRTALAQDSGGMVGAVVPMRRLGWTRLSLVDPAFAPAAAAASLPQDRAFPRPVLLTADEVTLVPEGGDPARLVLRDVAADRPRGDRSRGPGSLRGPGSTS